jgi:hypothetical protein
MCDSFDENRRAAGVSTLLPCLCLHQILDPQGDYAAAAARLKQVLQYRAYVRSPMQLAADEFEAALLREGLVQVAQQQHLEQQWPLQLEEE